jgi:hypothetical protein
MLLFRLSALVIFTMVASAASAQSLEGYVTCGTGRWVHSSGNSGSLMVAAGGGEWLPTRHLGIAGEGGMLTSVSGDVAASLGVDARLHFRGASPPGEWAPYAFAGYSPLRFFELSDQGVQFGAGIDYRLSDRRALRLELRDIVRHSGTLTSHYWTARVGVTFR